MKKETRHQTHDTVQFKIYAARVPAFADLSNRCVMIESPDTLLLCGPADMSAQATAEENSSK
jgi:hypothetical protein